MAVKMNKEMLVKNRFWILLAVTTCLALFGLVYLQSVSADDDRKKFLEAIKAAKAKESAATKGPAAIELITKELDKAKSSEAKVWSDAYLVQRPLFTWPDDVEKNFDFYNGKFANEIAISKAPDKVDAWPADAEFLVHGILTYVDENVIKVRDRKGKEETFRRTVKIKITLTDDAKGTLLWDQTLQAHQNKLFAVKFQVAKYFNDPLTSNEQRTYAKSYKPQVHDILRMVEPLDEKGNGVTQLKNWLYKPDEYPDAKSSKFIHFVDKEWDPASDFSAEAWIAQEDLWIQTEIYRIIKDVNDQIKVFQGKGGGKREQPYTFKNANFELELVLFKDDTLSFKIKNLHNRRQKLDLSFKVKLNNGPGLEPETISISGLPLMPKGSKEDSRVYTFPVGKDSKNAPRKGIYRVEQVMNWEAAAVKRIDEISIGSAGGETGISSSHRSFVKPLVPFVKPLETAKDASPTGDAATQMPLGPTDKGSKVPMPGGFGGFGGGGNTAGNKTETKHGLWTYRYVEISNVSRRLPVGVALIVDQDYVDRVLTAFNNSKLRFLESQVLLNHYSGSLQPLLPDEKKDFEFGGFGGFGGKVNPPPFRFPMGPVAPMGPVGPMGVGAGNGTQSTGSSGGLETNMELVIYGVVTLYQRYPPRPGDEKKE